MPVRHLGYQLVARRFKRPDVAQLHPFRRPGNAGCWSRLRPSPASRVAADSMSVKESSGEGGAGTENESSCGRAAAESGPRRRLAGPARCMDGEQQTTHVENL